MVEADQQIGEDGGHLPEDKQKQQVVRRDDTQHGQHEGVQVDKEAAGMWMSSQVAGCEKGHQKAGPGDNQAEQQAESVQSEPQGDVEAGHPGPLNGKDLAPHHTGPHGAQSGKQQEWKGRGEQTCQAGAGSVGRMIRW